MQESIILPAADPMPLPAPVWLFKILLILTFVLHLVVMNFMLGGSLIALFTRLFGKGEQSAQVFADIKRKIPSLLAATITLGIAPLLFVQVLYGQFFYTASIVMAWPWLLVIAFLILAYYGLYLVAFRDSSRGSVWPLAASVVLLLLIAFSYTNNLTLMNSPERWPGSYFSDPSGWNLNLGDPSLLPRYLHFIVASAAIGGFLLIATGLFRWRHNQDPARLLIQYGGRWFMYATMAQFVVGVWFLMSLPREQMRLFMGGNPLATALLLLGVVGAIAAVVLMARGLRRDDPRPAAKLSMGITALVVVFMVLMRDALRNHALARFFEPEKIPVQTQVDVLALFLLLFVAGIVIWVWMMRRFFTSPAGKAA